MGQKFRFYKEEKRWYIDLPDWAGTKDALEMVAGADTMLDYMSKDTSEVYVIISIENFDGADELKFQRLAEDIGEGAYYILEQYQSNIINLEMWLCDVTQFVFGCFPPQIFIKSA